MLKRIDNFILSLHRVVLELFSILLIFFVTLLDYVTGPELSFSLFYLIPITFSVWYLRIKFGLFICLVSASAWLFVDFILSDNHYSHPSIPFWNTAVRFGFFIIVSYLLERLQNSLELQESLAELDTLTGLLNGRAFKNACASYFELAARNHHSVCLAYIDLDGFKSINDSLGHSVGDEVLRLVADTMAKRIRGSDIGARMGGDEFAILLPETNREGADVFFSTLQNSLLEEMETKQWNVGFSIGVAVFHSPENNIDEAIRRADALMYKVKKSGKNRVILEEYGVKA